MLAAADSKRVFFVGRKVQRDISNLEYTFDDVCNCIAQVPNGIYLKAQDIDLINGTTVRGDSYQVNYQAAERDFFDQIYLKFFMKKENLFLCSLHL